MPKVKFKTKIKFLNDLAPRSLLSLFFTHVTRQKHVRINAEIVK